MSTGGGGVNGGSAPPSTQKILVIDRSLVRPNYSAEASAEASAEPNLEIPGRTEPKQAKNPAPAPRKIRILKPGANHFLRLEATTMVEVTFEGLSFKFETVDLSCFHL